MTPGRGPTWMTGLCLLASVDAASTKYHARAARNGTSRRLIDDSNWRPGVVVPLGDSAVAWEVYRDAGAELGTGAGPPYGGLRPASSVPQEQEMRAPTGCAALRCSIPYIAAKGLPS